MNEKKPLYLQITEYMQEKIESNEWKPGQLLPSEDDLSSKFKVSRITTKRAMEELVKKGLIFRKKGQGSFVSNIYDINRKVDKKIVSIIIPYGTLRKELIDYVKGATDYLNKNGYYLSVHCVEDESTENEKQFLRKLPNDGIVGIIFYPLNVSSDLEYLIPMHINGYPIVLIDKYFDSIEISSVVSDNYNGTYKVINQLLNEGHTKISFLSRIPVEQASSLKERYYSYCKALQEKYIFVDHSIVMNGYHDELKNVDDKVLYMTDVIKEHIEKGVTAMVIEHDLNVLDAIGNLLQQGFEFPANFTIVGYDQVKIPEYYNMSCISVEQDYYQIGYKAAEMIIDKIQKNDMKCKKEVLPIKVEYYDKGGKKKIFKTKNN